MIRCTSFFYPHPKQKDKKNNIDQISFGYFSMDQPSKCVCPKEHIRRDDSDWRYLDNFQCLMATWTKNTKGKSVYKTKQKSATFILLTWYWWICFIRYFICIIWLCWRRQYVIFELYYLLKWVGKRLYSQHVNHQAV